MKSFFVLTESIHYIEQNLCEPITRRDIAAHSYVSLSNLEKLFRYALHRSIKEYITKRRITQATKDLIKNDMNIIEIAMKYQYNSPEVFLRSFKQVWNITPSEFTRKWKFTNIFPKINYDFKEGDDFDMARKKVDLSDAYNYFIENSGSYVLCFDIKNLTLINSISLKAGDLAILEMALRIDNAATDDMLVLRIGGDEFALITGLYDINQAKNIADEVIKTNGKPILFEGNEIPLSLWVGMTTIPKSSLRYNDFFDDMHKTIINSKS